MTALGRFTLTIAATQIGDGQETSARIQVRLQGVHGSLVDRDADLLLTPHPYANEKSGVSLAEPLEISLPTDVPADADPATRSEVIGWEVKVTTPRGGTRTATFAARPAGTTVAFADVVDVDEVVQPSDGQRTVAEWLTDPSGPVRAALLEVLDGLDLGGGGGASSWDELEGIPTDLETTGGAQAKANAARTAAEATAAALVDQLKGAAPAAYDTLVEIAAKLQDLDDTDDAVAAILATLADKVDEADLDDLIGILAATPGSDVKALLDGKVATTDPRLADPRTPTGGAGGVLSGSFPNPGFAVDMATQAELDAALAAEVTARNSAITAEATARNTAIATAIANLVNGAPGALDTLKELADQMTADEGAAATLTALVGAIRNLTDPTHTTALNAAYGRVWKASTAYVAGDIVRAPDGSLVQRISDGTSGVTYSGTNWTTLVATKTSNDATYAKKAELAPPSPAAVTAIDPAAMADKIAWFNADTLTGADASNVLAWPDSFGLHDANTVSTTKPTLRITNGVKAVRFASAALQTATFTNVPQPITIAMLVSFPNPMTAGNTIIMGSAFGQALRVSISTPQKTWAFHDGGARTLRLPIIPTWQTVVFVRDNATSKVIFRVNGRDTSPPDASGTKGLDQIRLGAFDSAGSAAFGGDIAEVIAVGHAASTSEIKSIEKYLDAKRRRIFG